MTTNIRINCHSSICLDDNIYIDPFNIKTKKANAKLIFITHPHFDHLDIESIQNIMTNETIFICTEDSAEQIRNNGVKNQIITVAPNDSGEVKGVRYKTFPAYNFGHHHFRKYGYVGYKLHLKGNSFTICGDSDLTPELESIKTDVLFVPIGGTFTMDVEEAAKLTNEIKPQVSIPVHYGFLDGTAPLSAADEYEALIDKSIKVFKIIK